MTSVLMFYLLDCCKVDADRFVPHDDGYLLDCHYNPPEKAGMVDEPWEYRYFMHGNYFCLKITAILK